MSDIKISVVTISFNEVRNIETTLLSVLNQSYKNIEYFVQDGGSNDGTVDIIKKYNCDWVSEKDAGLYDGMNKGLARCTGDYVIFINAGDSLVSDDVIEKMVTAADKAGKPDLVFGDCVDILDGKRFVRVAHGPQFIEWGMPASHEAMMYKLSVIREKGLKYDTSYRIAADYRFTYQFVKAAKTFERVSIPVVTFAEGGVSTSNKWKGLSESCRARREVGHLSAIKRGYIRAAQSAAIILSTYAKPIYRAIRLRK